MIRIATRQDAAGVAPIWNQIIRDTQITFNPVEKTVDEVAAVIDETNARGHAFMVAEDARGRIIGFASYGQFRGGNGYAHSLEHSIVLSDMARGQGTGRALMTALLDHARGAGGHVIFAGVSSANPAGRAFHRAIGFRDVVTLKEVGFKFGDWLDLHLMEYRLADDSQGENS